MCFCVYSELCILSVVSPTRCFSMITSPDRLDMYGRMDYAQVGYGEPTALLFPFFPCFFLFFLSISFFPNEKLCMRMHMRERMGGAEQFKQTERKKNVEEPSRVKSIKLQDL